MANARKRPLTVTTCAMLPEDQVAGAPSVEHRVVRTEQARRRERFGRRALREVHEAVAGPDEL